jgi:hypothetical protein
MHDTVHSLTQLPLTVSVIMVGVLVIFRAYDLMMGRPAARSVAVTSLIGLLLVLIGAKQAYWGTVWALKASGLQGSIEELLSKLVVPTVINILCIITGGAVVAIASKPYLGRWASFTVAGALVGLIAVQIGLHGGAR